MEEQEHQQSTDQTEPELLYHYTDQKGLLGILDSKSIWATHFRYLNDTSEGRIVFSTALDELNSRVNSDAMMLTFGMQPIKRSKKIECEDEEIFSQGVAMLTWVTSPDVFVTSFSEKGDSLSQWRAYSGRSGGYSIGFRLDYLREVGRNFLGGRSVALAQGAEALLRCIYYNKREETALKDEVERMVTAYIGEAAEMAKLPMVEGIQGFRTPAALAIRHFLNLGTRSAITKDDGFREEAEWRLAFLLRHNPADIDIEVRPGSSMPIPYLAVPLSYEGMDRPISIDDIIVGPCPHPSEAAKSVELLLARSGFRGVRVKNSQIPYRSW
jgi:hypothetical protein